MLLKNIVFSSFVLAGLTVMPVAAHAGFDWTPAPQKNETSGVPAGQAAPDQAETGPLTPAPDMAETATSVPVTNVDAQDLPAPGTFATNQEAQEIVKAQEAPAETTAETPASTAQTDAGAPVVLTNDAGDDAAQDTSAQMAPMVPATDVAQGSPKAEENYEGFGKDLSLVLALRDIVPAQYAYSFSDPSYAGLSVSWRGGKPWQDVLNDALAAHHLTSSVSGQAVVISPIVEHSKPQEAQTPLAVEQQTPVQEEAPNVATDEEAVTPAPTVAQAQPAAAQPAPAVDVPVIQSGLVKTWTARPGYTLKEVMEDWGKISKVEVEWNSPYDYPINNAYLFKGTYEEAVKGLLSQYTRETPRPRGRLYPNLPQGPSVLMIN